MERTHRRSKTRTAAANASGRLGRLIVALTHPILTCNYPLDSYFR